MTAPSISRASSDSSQFHTLPDSLLVEILEYVSVIDGRSLLMTCATLNQSTIDIESRRHSLILQSDLDCRRLVHNDGALLQNLTRLQNLTTGKWASGELVQTIGRLELLPELRHISMIASVGVDNDGLRALARGEARRQNLQTIDITFCQNTTFPVTLWLRNALPNLQLIRRLPEWMEGCYETPFQRDGLHTYWADGSFSFNREKYARGWVARVQPWDYNDFNHVSTKLFYSDVSLKEGQENLQRHHMLAGVSLLRIPPECNNGSDTRTVLVAQNQRFLAPPRDYPTIEQMRNPVGETQIFIGNQGHVMITRMRVHPLESLMPPVDVVEDNAEFAQALQAFQRQNDILYRDIGIVLNR